MMPSITSSAPPPIVADFVARDLFVLAMQGPNVAHRRPRNSGRKPAAK
jgi:hypothetical protein